MAAAAPSRFTAGSLEESVGAILVGLGADATVAADLATSCVRTSVRGVDSHGLGLVPKIIRRVQDPTAGGTESADADLVRTQLSQPAVVVPGLDESLPVAVVDARLSPGQHSCLFAARLAAEKAKRSGIAMVAVRNSTHFGACVPFLQELLAQGLVGMVGSNCTPSMAGLGSPVANMGNMPWGFAAPVAGDTPDFLFDFCCAVMSFGRLNKMKAAGDDVPDDAFKQVQMGELSDEKRTFTNLAACTNLGMPFGGHKGSAVAMMIEVLSGCLSFGNFGARAECIDGGKFLGPSHFVIAIDPAKFNAGGEGSSGTDFAEGMRRYVADIKAPDPDGIKYAGERAQAVSADRTANGIPIAADLEADLRAFAAEAGVEINLVQA